MECGEGEQERTVFCQQEHEPDIYVMVEDSLCHANPRPRSNRPCDTGVPCPEPEVSVDTASEVSSSESEMSESESESDVSSPPSEDSDADSEMGETTEWDVSDLLPQPEPEKVVRSAGLYPAVRVEPAAPAAWDLGPWSAVSELA